MDMTLSDMKTHATFLTKIEGFINARYEDILNRVNHPEAIDTATITATADAETMMLNRDIDYVIDIHDRVNDIHLTKINPSIAGRSYADSQDVSGTPRMYWWAGMGMSAQPLSVSVITIKSDSASDTSQVVRIWGIDSNGAERSETISLNGTTGVDSSGSYTKLTRVSKDAVTVGLITGTSNSEAVTVFKIDPRAFSSKYITIHLLKRPDSAIAYTVTFKLKTPPLQFDEDVPIISCSQALILGGYIDSLREQRQHAKAKLLEYNASKENDPSTYEGKVLQLIARSEQWADNVPLFRPHVQKDSIDSVSGNLNG